MKGQGAVRDKALQESPEPWEPMAKRQRLRQSMFKVVMSAPLAWCGAERPTTV